MGLTPRTAVLLFFVFLAFYSLFFSPIWLEGRSLAPGDALQFYRPNFLPMTLWEPNLMTGFPVAADPQVMTWYPLSLLLSWMPRTWNLFVISAYTIGSWFMCLYALALTGNLSAGLLSGLIYGLNGFFMMHLAHISMIQSAAWLPAMLLAAERLRNGGGIRWIAAGAAATGTCVLAGHTQIAVYGLSLVGAYVLAMGFRKSDRRKYYVSAYGFLALGIALAAVQILPAAELSRLTIRSSLTYAMFTQFSLSWSNLLTLLFPCLMGCLTVNAGPTGYLEHLYFGPWNLAELAGFAGYGAMVLAAVALSVRRRYPAALFWLAAGLCGLALSLGGATPLGRMLFYIPVFNLFRAQGRFLLIVDLATAVLAGCGLHAILTQPQLRDRFTRISILMLAGLFALALSISFIFGPHLQAMATGNGIVWLPLRPWENLTIGIPLLSGMMITALIGFLLRAPKSRIALICLLLGIVADLGTFDWFTYWRYASPPSSVFQMPPALAKERDALHRMSGRWLPVQGSRTVEAFADLSRLWDIPSVSKHGPLLPRRIHELLTLETHGWVSGHWADGANRAFDLVGARYIVQPLGSPTQPEDLDGANAGRWRFVEELEGSPVVENLRAMPRTWLVDETIPLPPEQIVDAIHTSHLPDGRTYDPAAMALIEKPRPFHTAGHGTAEIIAASNTSVQIQTHADHPAFLVLADFDYPGWQCTINGEKTMIYTTNYIQRGVFLPAGTSIVQFRFRPLTLYVGMGVSMATLLFLAYLCKRSTVLG